MIKRTELLGIVFLFGAQMLWAQVHPSEGDVFALAKPAYAGDRTAVRALFGHYPLSDGAVAEYINSILGRVARIHPKVFLKELKAHRNDVNCSNVSNTGEELVDRPNEQLSELYARRDALESVSEKSLLEYRDACIAQLQESINFISEVLEMEPK